MKKLIVLFVAMISLPVLAQSATERRLDLYDQNRDNKLSLEELQFDCEVSKKLFDRADGNGDGLLSFKELRQAKEYIFSRCSSKV